jgi:hypothetical protein
MNPIVKTLIGAALGAGAGWLMYRFIGCRTGACPITAKWWTSMLYGSILGAVAASGK